MTMATVRDILSRKGTDVVSVPPTATVLEAARRMNERSIGGVAVLADGVLGGMVTIGDLLAFQLRDQQATIEYMNNLVYDVR